MNKHMDRNSVIEKIIGDLNSMLSDKPVSDEYAIRENLAFFEAMKSVPAYACWLLFRAPEIDPAKLLELTDFPLPKWVREMHLQLIEIERREFPGLIKPLVDNLIQFITQENPRTLVNFGCGGMEAERQVIERLRKTGYPNRVIFIGVDKSPVVKDIVRANMKGLEDAIDIYEVEELSREFLTGLLTVNLSRHAVVMCKNDIFGMDDSFNEGGFDLIFNSMFRHHLSESQKDSLDRISSRLAKAVMEYDNYRGWLHLIPPSIGIWNKPPLLNGAIFSRLKAPVRKELEASKQASKQASASPSMRFFKMIGTYLLKYNFGH